MNAKILTFPLRLAIIILVFGALFKVMHWPFANQLMLVGSAFLGLLYTIRFLYKQEKFKLDYVKLTMILLWVFSYLVKALHLVNMPYVFEIVLLILFIYWFSIQGLAYFKNRKFKKNKFLKAVYYLLIGFAVFGLCFGALFKIQHWPYGALLFTFGILLTNILLVFDYFLVDRKIK